MPGDLFDDVIRSAIKGPPSGGLSLIRIAGDAILPLSRAEGSFVERQALRAALSACCVLYFPPPRSFRWNRHLGRITGDRAIRALAQGAREVNEAEGDPEAARAYFQELIPLPGRAAL